jgi:ABC-type multidrug transport system fused ATPase/permease subunit
MRHDARFWCLMMFLCAVTSLFAVFIQRFSFGIIGENITLNVRNSLYKSILKKSIGWFDSRDNAAGVITSVLASEVQTLNGASTEGLAVIIETSFALCCGIILGFIFNWKVSLVALGCIPFMVVGGAINAKFQAGFTSQDEDAYKDANLLGGDAIQNYRTVASFGHDEIIINEYSNYLQGPLKNGINRAHKIGLAFGFSQFNQNAVFALLYYAGAEFNFHDSNNT